MNNLGDRIYNFRVKMNMSQDDLARKINVSRQSISKWENNISIPDLDKIVKLSDVLQVSLDELIKGEEKDVNIKITNSNSKENKNKIFDSGVGFSILLVIASVIFRMILAALANETYLTICKSDAIGYANLRSHLNTIFDNGIAVSLFVYTLANLINVLKVGTSNIKKLITYNTISLIGVFVVVTVFHMWYPKLGPGYHDSFVNVYLHILSLLVVCLAIKFVCYLRLKKRRKDGSYEKN